MNELKIALNMFLAPKKGFLALPKHKPCVLATLFVLLLMLERGLRSWDIYKQQISLWSFLGIVLMTFAVLWPLSGLFTMGLCRIFGKRISFWLAINICGFAHTPRVFSSSIIWFLPYSDISLFSKITIALFAMAILVYSTGLWIYGLVIVPDSKSADSCESESSTTWLSSLNKEEEKRHHSFSSMAKEGQTAPDFQPVKQSIKELPELVKVVHCELGYLEVLHRDNPYVPFCKIQFKDINSAQNFAEEKAHELQTEVISELTDIRSII